MAGHTRKQNKQKRKGPVVSGAPQKGTVGAFTGKPSTRKPIKKSTRKPVKKATAKKPTSKKSPAKKISNLTKRGKLGLITGIGTVIAGATALRNKPKSFGEAFKKARKDKGPNSTFTYKGKKYSTVTKDQIKKAGFTNLRDYLNSKKKK
jgi:hypothetical protein